MKYVQINLTVFIIYFQVNTNQATVWENKELLFVRSVKLKDFLKNSFLLSFLYSSLELDIILFSYCDSIRFMNGKLD